MRIPSHPINFLIFHAKNFIFSSKINSQIRLMLFTNLISSHFLRKYLNLFYKLCFFLFRCAEIYLFSNVFVWEIFSECIFRDEFVSFYIWLKVSGWTEFVLVNWVSLVILYIGNTLVLSLISAFRGWWLWRLETIVLCELSFFPLLSSPS